MKLRYRISTADVVALRMFDFEHSPLVRRRLFISRVILATAMLAVGFALFLVSRQPLLLLLAVALAAGAVAVYPAWLRRLIATRTARAHRDSKKLGEYEMRVSDEGLEVTNPIGSSSVRWEGIEAIGVTDTHTFVYHGVQSAYIISRRGVVEGDYERLVADLESRAEGARAEPTSSTAADDDRASD